MAQLDVMEDGFDGPSSSLITPFLVFSNSEEQGRIAAANDRLVLKTNSAEHQWSCPPSLSEGSHHQDWFVGVAEDFRLAATAGDKGNLDEAVLFGGKLRRRPADKS